MQFTATLIALLATASAVGAYSGTNIDAGSAEHRENTRGLLARQAGVIGTTEYNAQIRALIAREFPGGRPSTRPVQGSQPQGAFACTLCAWGCGSEAGNWTCDCCAPGGACKGHGC
ncbi:hypothetical protein ACN47E_007300 [Coniothyrium glycines]